MFQKVRMAMLRLKAWRLFGHRNVHVHGDFTAIDPSRMVVGKNVAINHGVFLLGRSRITIGDNVVLSARCMLMDGGLDLDGSVPTVDSPHSGAPIVIEDGAWIGAGAIILAGVTIGRNSVIGAGSVVTRDVPENCIAAGNPAKVLRSMS